MTIVQIVNGTVLFDTATIDLVDLITDKERDMLAWFLNLSLEKKVKIIKPHYEQWYHDQQVELEKVRG